MTHPMAFDKAPAVLSDAEFRRLSEFIHAHCGIKMPPGKKVMLEGRLQKRLRALGLTGFREYCDFLFQDDGAAAEITLMIDAVTTNKTDFFREPVHFNLLAGTILPRFLERERQPGAPFLVWSAGCSTGEEPYSIAMTLSEFALVHPGFRWDVLATDISTKVLDHARTAIYDEERVDCVPAVMRQRYLLRGKNRRAKLVRIAPELRNRVAFQRLNLMDEGLRFAEPFDAVFCRNVIIYFDRATQEALINRLCRQLRPGGHLFLGHSESLHGFELPLERLSSTVYRKV